MILTNKEDNYLSTQFFRAVQDLEAVIDDDENLDYDNALYEEVRRVWKKNVSAVEDCRSDVDMNSQTKFSLVKTLTTTSHQLNYLMKLEL